MKQILLNPLFFPLLLGSGIIYLTLLFSYVNSNQKRSLLFEKIVAGFFIFLLSGATGAGGGPWSKLHPLVLYQLSTTPPTIIANLGFYTTAILILASRLRYTLRNIIHPVFLIITKDGALPILFVIMGLSTFWSETPDFTWKASIVYLIPAAVAVYIGKQYSWTDLYFFLRWVGFAAALLSLFKQNPGPGGNWGGILGHKNQFSFFMSQAAVWWMLYAIYNPKRRWMSLLILFVALIGLQKGGSGASKVITVVLLGLWLYLGFVKKLPFQWAFASIVLFMIISICLTIVVTENLKFIVVDTLNKDMTLTGRTDFWPQIIDKINERPVLGYGISGFWQSWRGAEDPGGDIIVVKTQFKPPHSHNGFLDMGLEVGYVGIILYLITFFNNLAKGIVYLGRTKEPESVVPILLLTYILMTNITEVGLFGPTSEWFWFVAMTVRLTLDTTGNSRSRTT